MLRNLWKYYWETRTWALSHFGFVDMVVFFDKDTPIDLIEKLQPDFLVKGADYDTEETDKTSKSYIVGSDIVIANGGEVKAIPLIEGYSTTSIISKLRD